MSDQELSELFKWNERLVTLISHILVSVMLACAVVSIVQLAERLVPSWNGGFLVALAWFAAMEAMYSRRKVREFDFLSGQWVLYRLAEWISLLVFIKLALYGVNGFEALLADLSQWQTNFLGVFFDLEYMFVSGVVILTWGLAGAFSEELAVLEGDEQVLKMEQNSRILLDRPRVRGHLADLTLMIGVVMIVIETLIRLDWVALPGRPPALTSGVVNLVVYFVLTLILLSLTQFAVLRVHWGLERIPINRDLARRWFLYAAGFLFLLAAAAVLLPTRYSLGLFDALGYVVGFLGALLNLLLVILMLPIFLLLSLLARLFGQPEPIRPPVMQPLDIPPPTAGSDPWLEVIKSILFWLVFGGIILYSVYHYLSQNQALVSSLKLSGLIRRISRLWQRLRGWLFGLNRTLTGAARAGLERLNRRRADALRGAMPLGFTHLRRLSPRQRVIFFYLAMVRRGRERGMPRHPAQTPAEYSQELEAKLPEASSEIGMVTREFLEARYSQHEISPEQANRVKQGWVNIRRALRRALNDRQ